MDTRNAAIEPAVRLTAAGGAHGRYTFGGLSDAGFAAITALEHRRDAGWPF